MNETPEVLKNIIVVGTNIEGVVNMTTTATNWGDLKNEICQNHPKMLNPTGNNAMKVTVMDANSNNFTVDSATNTLPQGDFRIMLTPTKNKSGEATPDAEFLKDTREKILKVLDWAAENINETRSAVPIESEEIQELRRAMAQILAEDGISL